LQITQTTMPCKWRRRRRKKKEEEEDCFHLSLQCVASTTLGPCRNGLA
jgi:hypothetical protein